MVLCVGKFVINVVFVADALRNVQIPTLFIVKDLLKFLQKNSCDKICCQPKLISKQKTTIHQSIDIRPKN